jgi:DNA-binding transcriptional ArsR family regulator
MVARPRTVEPLFQALAHPVRRQVVERLGRGACRVTDLAAPFEMALPSFLQHLRLLEQAGLIRSTKSGRVRTCELVPVRLAEAEHWLATQRRLWERRLDRLDATLHHLHAKERSRAR